MVEEENILTNPDALGIMCADIRAIARELEYGQMQFPNNSNPSMVLEVHGGRIKQVAVVLHGDNGIDKTKRYRAD